MSKIGCKFCLGCGKSKEDFPEEFSLNSKSKQDGSRTVRARCKTCRSKVWLDAYRKTHPNFRLRKSIVRQTDKNRGLLCQRCNVGIGHFEDSPELLITAAQYLNEWR